MCFSIDSPHAAERLEDVLSYGQTKTPLRLRPNTGGKGPHHRLLLSLTYVQLTAVYCYD